MSFTHLLSYRSVIAEVGYAIDQAKPTTLYPLPPADPKDALRIPADAKIYFDVPGDTRFLTAQLKYRDGATSKVQRFTRQDGARPDQLHGWLHGPGRRAPRSACL